MNTIPTTADHAVNAPARAALHAWARAPGHVRISRNFSWRESFEQLVSYAEELCRRYGVRIEIVEPSRTKTIVFSAGGILAAAGAGFILAGPSGAVAGAGVGLIAGYSASYLRIVWESPNLLPPSPSAAIVAGA